VPRLETLHRDIELLGRLLPRPGAPPSASCSRCSSRHVSACASCGACSGWPTTAQAAPAPARRPRTIERQRRDSRNSTACTATMALRIRQTLHEREEAARSISPRARRRVDASNARCCRSACRADRRAAHRHGVCPRLPAAPRSAGDWYDVFEGLEASGRVSRRRDVGRPRAPRRNGDRARSVSRFAPRRATTTNRRASMRPRPNRVLCADRRHLGRHRRFLPACSTCAPERCAHAVGGTPAADDRATRTQGRAVARAKASCSASIRACASKRSRPTRCRFGLGALYRRHRRSRTRLLQGDAGARRGRRRPSAAIPSPNHRRGDPAPRVSPTPSRGTTPALLFIGITGLSVEPPSPEAARLAPRRTRRGIGASR